MTNENQQPPKRALGRASGEGMTMERLRALVDSYGTNLARMPAEERAQVESLLTSSDAAQKVWHEAAELDLLLDEKPVALGPSEGLMLRLQAIPAQEKQLVFARASQGVLRPQVVHLPRRANVWAALAAAAALLLGVLTGSQQEQSLATQQDEAATLSEFGALALGSELVTDLGQFEGDVE